MVISQAIISAIRRFTRRNWISVAAAFGCLRAGSLALAQTEVAATAPLNTPPLELNLGPLDLHPRVTVGMVADDNLLFTSTNKEADISWSVQPGLQAVIGDDAALIANRDQNGDVLGLNPGSLIVQSPEAWSGKIFMPDYAPRFKFYDKYTANNAIDQFATLNLLWPMNKLVLGFRQDYQLENATVIEAGQADNGRPSDDQMSRTKSRTRTFNAFATRASASTEIVFSVRSTSPIYFGFRSATSPSCSWVISAFFR